MNLHADLIVDPRGPQHRGTRHSRLLQPRRCLLDVVKSKREGHPHFSAFPRISDAETLWKQFLQQAQRIVLRAQDGRTMRCAFVDDEPSAPAGVPPEVCTETVCSTLTPRAAHAQVTRDPSVLFVR